ncbi:MAG: phosphoenolpyruvate synthase [Nanoarchaeota archaeon]|nr:phosphoenolpyruvate synthase [Nanoarchaeota archaeon]
MPGRKKSFILWFHETDIEDVPLVGGKNASIGEMIQKTKVPIPEGFSITAQAYKYFIDKAGLHEFIYEKLKDLDTHDIKQLMSVGASIRKAVRKAKIPKDLEKEILANYKMLGENMSVAVRSSATAEDLPTASFAGQQESFLNVKGNKNLLKKVKDCFASLFTNRAISYRQDKGFDHFKVYLSVAVQRMVRSDLASAGVSFTIDPDSGYDKVIIINASWGLGDYVVQGVVTPDEYVVFKPTMTIIDKIMGSKKLMEVYGRKGVKRKKVSEAKRNVFVLTNEEILEIAKYSGTVEKHYKRPMDLEWAKDGLTNKLYIVQARPETVQSQKKAVLKTYKLKQKSKVLVNGMSIGRKIATGKVKVINNVKKIHSFQQGEILVTVMTDPDWEPIMKKASAIITNEGGRTAHAAIVSREIGVPAIVGTGNATKKLKTGMEVTVDCTKQEGKIWKGKLDFTIKKVNVKKIPKTKTKVMINLGEPDMAFDIGQLPVDGVGLAREEFIIQSFIGQHPLHLIKQGKSQFFIDQLARGIARIAAGFYPRPVIVRFSDFKTNEYRGLEGGEEYEPVEDNPMLGWRGASRYTSPEFEPAFRLELRAIKKVRENMKLTNVKVMIPFCRTIKEATSVLKIMESEGLERGRKGLEVYVMAEIPSNIISAHEFAKHFDGFSIGSNDLTQLTLGIDRDSEQLIKEFDERDPAVKELIRQLIKKAHAHKPYKQVGICGQAPSDFPEYVEWLVNWGIDSISVNPDVAIETMLRVAKIEKELKKKKR